MLLQKTKRPSTLTGRNVRLSNLLINSCLELLFHGEQNCDELVNSIAQTESFAVR